MYRTSLPNRFPLNYIEMPLNASPKHLRYDRNFIERLPFLNKILEGRIPNLLLASKKAVASSDLTTFYNQDTFKEFHQVLCELLRRFHESLATLEGLSDSTSQDDFGRDIHLTACLGEALHTMVGGTFIQKHLQVISLDPKDLEAIVKQEEPEGGEAKRIDAERLLPVDGLEDPELTTLKPFTVTETGVLTPLWVTLGNWLQLMVVHFVAVSILAKQMENLPNSPVTFKILVTPHPDKQQLEWKVLLKNSRYINQEAVNGKTPNDIIVFLDFWRNIQKKSAIPVETLIRYIKNLRSSDATMTLTQAHIDKIFNIINGLSNNKSPGWTEFLENIQSCVQSLSKHIGDHVTSDELDASLMDIIGQLESLRDRSAIFVKLNQLTSSGFIATDHCEAKFLSIMSQLKDGLPSDYKAIADELAVSYIFPCLNPILKFYI